MPHTVCRRLVSTVGQYFQYLEEGTRFASSDYFCLFLKRHSQETFTFNNRFPTVPETRRRDFLVDFKLSFEILKF
jgi:hypothetical protein